MTAHDIVKTGRYKGVKWMIAGEEGAYTAYVEVFPSKATCSRWPDGTPPSYKMGIRARRYYCQSLTEVIEGVHDLIRRLYDDL